MTDPQTPATEAGRRLLARLEWAAQRHEVEPADALDLAERSILAIEAEARVLERALWQPSPVCAVCRYVGADRHRCIDGWVEEPR